MTPVRMVQTGDVELAAYSWGTPGTSSNPKPTVVMVHGYPDSAQVWEKTAEILAKDFHVIAYDVRGTGRSSAPMAVKDYAIPLLMRDLEAVLDALAPGRVHLVTHDWGSIQSWEGVTMPPMQQRLASFTTMCGPSLDHVGRWMRDRLTSGSWRQIGQVVKQFRMSWYMLAFQIPGLAVAAWRRIGHKGWPREMKRLDGTIAEPTATQVRDGVNGSNLYRANIFSRLLRPRPRSTEVPVQLIVPARDPFANPDIYNDLPRWAPKLWRREIDAGHWVPLSHPAQIADFVREFVRFIESGDQTPALDSARVATVV